jgi:hypothetical protein
VAGALGFSSASTNVAFASQAVPPENIFLSIVAQETPTATAAITATTQLTPTEGTAAIITATAPVTGTSTTTTTLSTPVPIPTAAPPPATLQGNPFAPNFLFSAPPPGIPLGPFGWAALVFTLALLGASIYIYLVKRPEWKRTNSVLHRAANRWGQVGLWLGSLGLIFLLARVVRLDFFNLRFWLYLWALLLLISLGWFLYWYRTSYPKQIARYQKIQRARQYMPGSAAKSAGRGPSQAITTPAKGATQRSTGAPATPATPSQKGGKRRKRR